MPQRHKAQVNAFNLVPVVEQVLPDRTKTEVECIAISDKNLYVGTADGNIIYYQLEEKRSPFGKTLYQSKVKNRIQLGADKRRPIQQLTAVSAQKRLLALMDGMLYLMNMSTLELYDTGQRVTKLQCYCVNESKNQQPMSANFEVIVAPQRRKQIQQYILSGERLIHVKDYSIPEPAFTMARDGNAVCVALSGQEGKYVIIKLLEGNMFDLLAYESGCTPIVKRMGKGEFLVNGGTFGITTSVSGISNNGRFMGEFSGKLYASLDKSVYLLSAVPLKDQVSDLLEKQLVEEAVLLAETIAAVEASKSSTAAEEYMNEVKLRAAFIYLSTGSFSQAETLFHESLCDPREVIILFENLLPSNSTFQSSSSSLHGLPSMQVLAATSDLISLREAKKFLIRYLKEVRTTPLALGRREDIDTSLVKLLAEDHSSSLIPYITNHDLYLSFEETKQALEESQCYHALALLYYYSNQSSEALKIWTKIYDNELTDVQFPGFNYIIEFLSKCTTAEVVLHYAEWALARDQGQAVRVFTERKEQKESLEPAFVLNFLKPFPVATVAYLEHIINDKKSKEEAFHTQLAGCYLHELVELRGRGAPERKITTARIKLYGFLESSTCYDPACLLTEVQDTDMHRECAILYGRMEEHEKALSLLAHKLKDHSSAQDYCLLHSKGKGRVYRQNLYQILLRVYLSPKDTSQKVLIQPALTLLNAHGAQFDAAQVLELLPHEWPIVTVKAFLLHSVRGGMEASHIAKVESSLAKGENIQVRQKYISLQGDPIVITDNTRCPVCHLPFSDAAFVRYPNGVITHLKCGRNKAICPVTGTWFGEI